MKRKAYPKFIEINGHIITVSTIKTLQKINGPHEYIAIEYYNGCETKNIYIDFSDSIKRDEAFNKIMEELI